MARAEDIKKAAFRLFAEKGYDATSIQDITKPVNIKKATFYSHFISKKELFTLILEEQARLVIDNTEQALKQSKAADLKEMLFDVFYSQTKVGFDRTRLLFWKRTALIQAGVADKEIQDDMNRIMENVNSTMLCAINSALKSSSVDLNYESFSGLMLMFFIFLQGYLDWLLIKNSPDEAHFRFAFEYFWNGMQSISR